MYILSWPIRYHPVRALIRVHSVDGGNRWHSKNKKGVKPSYKYRLGEIQSLEKKLVRVKLVRKRMKIPSAEQHSGVKPKAFSTWRLRIIRSSVVSERTDLIARSSKKAPSGRLSSFLYIIFSVTFFLYFGISHLHFLVHRSGRWYDHASSRLL